MIFIKWRIRFLCKISTFFVSPEPVNADFLFLHRNEPRITDIRPRLVTANYYQTLVSFSILKNLFSIHRTIVEVIFIFSTAMTYFTVCVFCFCVLTKLSTALALHALGLKLSLHAFCDNYYRYYSQFPCALVLSGSCFLYLPIGVNFLIFQIFKLDPAENRIKYPTQLTAGDQTQFRSKMIINLITRSGSRAD